MFLSQLCKQLFVYQISGDAQVSVTGLTADSRQVKNGDLFFAVSGFTVDGHDFASQAVQQGACALVVSRKLSLAIPQVIVGDPRKALAQMADFFYGRPSHFLKPIGVTGTNGKTTITYLIEQIWLDAKVSPGVIGTIETRYADKKFSSGRTTPDSLQLQQVLHAMRAAGTQRCVMEVSSHALEQGRVRGCDFKIAVFTNLTQDHLDYHGSLAEYKAAKALFFSQLGNIYCDDPTERKYAILNADDATTPHFAKQTTAEILTYGIENAADLQAVNVKISSHGVSFQLRSFLGVRDMTLKLIGKFNIYNCLAALGAALCDGIALDDAIKSLEKMTGIPGRVETVEAGQDFAIVVDYAHTPDGLENVLCAMKQFVTGQLIAVFGCGGDRDKSKRPLMGRIAAKYADRIILTSDNPRTEDPQHILDEIASGLIDICAPKQYEQEVDRKQAIEKAVEMAHSGDVVLILGKGHETYQIIGQDVIDFDDRLVVKEVIRSRMQ